MVMFVLRKPLNAQTHPKRRKIIFKPNKHGTEYTTVTRMANTKGISEILYVNPTDHEQCKMGN